MILINLLPWRQQQRQKQKMQFFYTLGASLLVILSAIIGIKVCLLIKIHAQSAVNQYLQTQNNILGNNVKKLQELKQQRLALLERMRLIDALQTQRVALVHLFEQIVRIAPVGVYFLQVQRIENTIILIGKADSNAKISELMRNITASAWLANPILTEIKADELNPKIAIRNFQLNMKMLHISKFYQVTS